MKILIIAKTVGRMAPGIVAERLILGLSKLNEVDVLTMDYDPSSTLDRVNKVVRYKYKEIGRHLSKIFISIFAVNPLDIFFADKAVAQCDTKYDVVLSFISSNHYMSLMTGNKLARKIKIKHFAHFLDAIPAPGGWLKDDLFYKGLKRLIAKNLSQVDGLFSSNQKMLDYQLTTFKQKKNIITGVIYCPGSGKWEYYKDFANSTSTFLFTGGLYGLRNPRYIIEAFKKILQGYPDSTLEFVGSRLPSNYLSIFSIHERQKIIIHPFTKDLSEYYERATALIDIDADIPNDVFLSSKISNYIMINRTIISETGENSPSGIIFKNIPSVLQCGHNVEELVQAMRKAILQKGSVDFNDRTEVISLFDIDSIAHKLNNKFAVGSLKKSLAT